MAGSTVYTHSTGSATVFGWSHHFWGWCGPALVAMLAFFLRVWHLGRPGHIQFDETYYAKDAWSMLHAGYPRDGVEDADELLAKHQTGGLFSGDPEQFVHPPAGKWLIALGERLFGMNPTGWRISAAVIGALTVLILARLVLRLTGSVVMGCLAESILTLDGLHFVLSRLALLDVFVAFWLVCGFACLVADRDWICLRFGRWRPWRPWQLAAGVCFGLACATKWSAVFPLAAFGLAVVGWEVFARYRASRDISPWRGWLGTTLSVGIPAFASLVIVAFVVYIASWSSWLIHYQVFVDRFGHGHDDYSAWGDWVNTRATSVSGHIIDAFRSLWHYHVMTYEFHTGSYLQEQTHSYQSNPIGWPVMSRPVGVDAQTEIPADNCGESGCTRQVLLLGNPVVWWSGALALVAGVVIWTRRVFWSRTREWPLGWALLGAATCWLPWFAYTDRPIFSFYAVTMLPFMIIVMSLIVYSVQRIAPSPRARYCLWLAVGAWLIGTTIAFWFFHPVWTDGLLTNHEWQQRMWFTSWI